MIIWWAAAVYASEPGDAKASARVNLRATPSLNGEILNTIPNGHNVRVIQTKGLWCQVDVAGEINDRGWVFARYLERIPPKVPTADSPPQSVRVETSIKEPAQGLSPVKLPPRPRAEAETAKPVSTSLLKRPLTTDAKGQSSLQNALRDAQKEPVANSPPKRSPVAEPVYRPPVRSISGIFKRDAPEISAKRASKLIEQADSTYLRKRTPDIKKKPGESAQETRPAVSDQPMPVFNARPSSVINSPAPHETKESKSERRSMGTIAVALKLVSIVLYSLIVLLLYKGK